MSEDKNHFDRPETALAETSTRLTRKLIRENPEEAAELFDSLSIEDRASLVMDFHGRARLELILLSRETRELVRALPPPELWLSLKEIGEEDSIELLRMASPEQWQYLVDLEWWHQEATDPLAVAYWLMLMNEAGPETVAEWFRHADEELLVTAFSRFFEVYRPDPDNEGAEAWRSLKNLWTLDNVYYLHFREPTLAPTVERALAQIRAAEDYKYYGLLDAISCAVLLEEEAEALRFRTSRLMDYGFVDFDEALEIYAPVSERELKELETEGEHRRGGRPWTPVAPPKYPLARPDLPPLLARALPLVQGREAREDLALGLGALANRLLVADAMDLTRLESLQAALAKAHVFVELGLQRWSEGEVERAARLLETQHPFTLFRAGYTRVATLARAAHRIRRSEWWSAEAISLLGDDGAIIEGLVRTRPAFYQGADDKGAPRYGQFSGDGDVRRAEQAVELVPRVGRLFFEAFRLCAVDLQPLRDLTDGELTFTEVLATGVANALAQGEFSFRPLSLDDARAALEIAFSPETPHVLRDDVAEQLQARMGEAMLRLPEASETDLVPVRAFVRACLLNLQEEVRALDFDALDGRFIKSLVIAG